MSSEKEIGILLEYLEFSRSDNSRDNENRKVKFQMYALLIILSALMYYLHTQGVDAITNYVLAAIGGYILALGRNIRASGFEVSVVSKHLDRDSITKRIEELNA